MINNFIPISRRLFEHRFWCEERIFSRFEAWLDILQSTRFEDTALFTGNRQVEIKRGQMPVSLRYLSERWKWSIKKVRNFMALLESEGMITRSIQKGKGQALITVCNYNKYNDAGQIKGTLEGNKRAHLTNCNFDTYSDKGQIKGTLKGNKKAHMGQEKGTLEGNEKAHLTDCPCGGYEDEGQIKGTLKGNERAHMGHTSGTKNNKDKESIERKENKELSPYTSYTPPTKGASINSRAREIFEKCFRDTFGNEYYWTGKDAGAMSGLLKKLSYSRSKKNLTNDDDSLLYALNVFLSSIKAGWIFENFSVTNINSKFNEIISQIYGKPIVKTKYQSAAEKAASRERLEELADEILGNNQPDEHKGRFPFA